MEMKEQQSAPEALHTEHTTSPTSAEEMEAQINGVEEEASSELTDLSPEALQEQLTQQCRKTEEYLDHLQRLQADFNNYRRRANQEKLLATSRGKEEVFAGSLARAGQFSSGLTACSGRRQCCPSGRADDLATV